MKRDTLRLLTGSALALFLTIHVVPATAAQDAAEASAQALPAATALIDKFEAATNAKHVAETTKCLHTKGKLKMAAMGLEGTMEAWEAKPDLSVAKIELAGMGEMTEGYNNGIAYRLNAMMGAQVIDGIELLQRSLEAGYGDLKERDKFETIETVGREKFNGKDCYKVKLVAKPAEGMDAESTKKARTIMEFYEVESGLNAGSVATTQSQMGEMEVTTLISDYKKFGEGLKPTKTVQKTAMGEIVIEIESVDYPDDVDMKIFDLPKEIAALVEKKKTVGAGK